MINKDSRKNITTSLEKDLKLFVDSATGELTVKDSSGNIATVQSLLGTPASATLVYRANFNQPDEGGALVTSEQENTTGLEISFARTSTGTFACTLSGDLTDKLNVILAPSTQNLGYVKSNMFYNGRADETLITISTYGSVGDNPPSLSDNVLINTSIQIVYYP